MTRCPVCDYDLRASLTSHGAHCPECGRRYTMRDLDNMLDPDPNGSPASLPGHERRLPGWGVLVIVIGAAALGASCLVWIFASTF